MLSTDALLSVYFGTIKGSIGLFSLMVQVKMLNSEFTLTDGQASACLLSVCEYSNVIIWPQAGGEEHHPDCDSVEDPGQESRSEVAAQSSGHRAVWTASRSECDFTLVGLGAACF